jgi:hypothetical protein
MGGEGRVKSVKKGKKAKKNTTKTPKPWIEPGITRLGREGALDSAAV